MVMRPLSLMKKISRKYIPSCSWMEKWDNRRNNRRSESIWYDWHGTERPSKHRFRNATTNDVTVKNTQPRLHICEQIKHSKNTLFKYIVSAALHSRPHTRSSKAVGSNCPILSSCDMSSWRIYEKPYVLHVSDVAFWDFFVHSLHCSFPICSQAALQPPNENCSKQNISAHDTWKL